MIMPPSFLTYDDRNMKVRSVGSHGTAPQELVRLAHRLNRAHKAIRKLHETKAQGFMRLPYEQASVKNIMRLSASTRRDFKSLLVIGIGGSDLGGRMLVEALAGKGMPVTFVGNPDPQTLSRLLRETNWRTTAVNVISKSGTTLETSAIFMAVREALIKNAGPRNFHKHIIATTDPDKGTLLAIARREGYAILPHPKNVGGRFAVLSSVGLFPAACAGVDVKRLLAGARTIEKDERDRKHRSLPAVFAAHHALASQKRGNNIHVLMPYADRLRSFGFWYRQIWAESLGKIKGDVSVGPTPIASLGSVDQHSQLQLYQDGPNDKIVTFIEVDDFGADVRLRNAWKDRHELAYIHGKTFTEIMHAERYGTAEALKKQQRPNGTLRIPRITPESVGALVMMYEIATAYMGELLGVNAYDQPGVEAGKKIAKAMLEQK